VFAFSSFTRQGKEKDRSVVHTSFYPLRHADTLEASLQEGKQGGIVNILIVRGSEIRFAKLLVLVQMIKHASLQTKTGSKEFIGFFTSTSCLTSLISDSGTMNICGF
jgi:hypothetical protein